MPESAPQQDQLLGIYQQLYPDEHDQAAQSSSHLDDRACDRVRNQSDSSLDEPAVTAMVPMIAWCIAIFWAEGWTPCEWPNNISPPTMANAGSGIVQHE